MSSTAIDPSVVKFAIALIVGSLLIEIVDRVSSTAAWTLVAIIVVGLLLNNPLAIAMINLGAQSLEKGVR